MINTSVARDASRCAGDRHERLLTKNPSPLNSSECSWRITLKASERPGNNGIHVRVTVRTASSLGTIDSVIILISRKAIPFARATAFQSAKPSVMRRILLWAWSSVRPHSSAKASNAYTSSGKLSAPITEVTRGRHRSGVGLTSNAGLRAHEPRSARKPWFRRWSPVLPRPTLATTRSNNSRWSALGELETAAQRTLLFQRAGIAAHPAWCRH